MRSISAAEDALLTAKGGRSTFFRVKVKDSGGTFRDLSTYPGRNLCVSATWKESVDSQGMDADITLKRESELISLAPLMSASPLNLDFAYPGSYAALLALGREAQIEIAVVPEGSAVQSGDWNLAFHGYIDEIDAGEGEHVKLRCSDLQGKLRDTWIERERLYAFAQGVNATKGCVVWRPSDTVAVGDRVSPTDGQKTGHFYRATSITTGITAATEPVWPTGGGSTVVDGGVTWTESGATSLTSGTLVETVMQQIIDDNLGAGVVTMVVPVSPGWAIKAYKQDRVSVWDALRMLTDQIGWDLRFRWNSGSSAFKLTFSAPNRTASVADRTFAPSQRYKLSRLPTQIAFIRNAVQVVYSDSAALDATGRPTRKTIARTNSGSITAYGRRFCEVAEASTSNIDSSTEATTLADNILSDLATPVAEHECDLPLFRFIEIGDYYKWTADGIHYDSDQSFGVTSYTHKVSGGSSAQARTTVACRGKPSAGFRRWHGKTDRDQHALDLANTDAVAVASSLGIGGIRLQISSNATLKKALPSNAEIHISATPSFTPSSSTLKAAGALSDVVIGDLIPGKTYYGKIVPFGFNSQRIVRAQPSPEFSFVAGQASAGHVQGGIAIGDYPLNGGFETRIDASGMPDHWTAQSGTLGTDLVVMEDANGLSGTRYMRLKGGSIQSAVYPMLQEANEASRRGLIYRFSWWRKAGSSASAYSALIRILDSTGAEIDILTVSSSMPADKAGHWVLEELFCRLKEGDSTGRSLQLRISGGGTGANQQIDVDEVRCQHLGTAWYEVGDTTYFTENYEAVPGFANSWVNFDATNDPKAAFRKDQFGTVYLKGRIKSGTLTSAAFTLPVGFRPPRPMTFVIDANATYGVVIVGSDGTVKPNGGGNVSMSLNGIFFMTTQVASTTT